MPLSLLYNQLSFLKCLFQLLLESIQIVVAFAQVLEWYTSTLEVRMLKGVGVRISSWVQWATYQIKIESRPFYFFSKSFDKSVGQTNTEFTLKIQ